MDDRYAPATAPTTDTSFPRLGITQRTGRTAIALGRSETRRVGLTDIRHPAILPRVPPTDCEVDRLR